MDQTDLYERASGSGEGAEIRAALLTCDRLILDHINANARPGAINIAELSIGIGQTTITLLDGVPLARLTCAEISETRIRNVREKIAQAPDLHGRMPKFIQCNLDTEFNFLASESFDAVIALDIMEHVVDVFGFIDNCFRILKDGGFLYLRTPNVGYLRHRIDLCFGRLPVTASWFGPAGDLDSWRQLHGWDGGHLHMFTLPVLRKLVADAGFSVESCQDPGTRFSNLRSLWPNLLFANPLLICRRAQ